ncbi:MAG: helix-turn-helix transcriptional regulator [Proteobacteria bacterium]|nr:helix-turn-helix transcriptional regulator [Pseudomonadota bacterium]MBU2226414.1 helix-turn-helix transcriptional regulator [Pseudomonadota bacterium]MBU2262879.1 helix-turn-helix transcriptional regulator [Pseudomonadota bacterium]
MSDEMMNTKGVARYLDIHEKQVYALIKTGRIPATRVTGKWIFPKRMIDAWIEANAKSGLEQAKQKGGRIAGALLASGSNDPVLDILQTCLRKAHPEFFIFSANTGSSDGLDALDKGYTDIAWSHLFHPESGEYNIPYIEERLPHVKAVVVNLFFRDLGFLTAPGNPVNIRGVEDLAKEGVRFVNRQAGSGTRLLLDHHLGRTGISPEHISGYEQEVFTHLEVGLAILSGGADTGIATVAVANLLGLAFSPITRERFDMICDQSVFFQKGVQALVETLTSETFRKRVENLGNYDFSAAGRILYVKP